MAAAIAVTGPLAASARAESTTITSFDGTPIHVNFFPAPGLGPRQRAPSVLLGPGWGSPGGHQHVRLHRHLHRDPRRRHDALATVDPARRPPGYGAVAPNGCTGGGTVNFRLPPRTRAAHAAIGRRVLARGRRRLTVRLVGLGWRSLRLRIVIDRAGGPTRVLTRTVHACP